MKAILISIKPKWCALMMNGKKKVEVRKGTALYKAIQKLIDEYGYADIYVYCTKGKNDLRKSKWFGDYILPPKMSNYRDRVLNGKVIFKFRCYKVEEIKLPYTKFGTNNWVGCENERKWQTPTMNEDKLLDLSCLEELELYGYLKGKISTAIHISDLEIFDKPKELANFLYAHKLEIGKCDKCSYCWKFCHLNEHFDHCPIMKAPQSWCYVEVGE